MYSKAFSILPTPWSPDYVTERIKCLLCQQGNYMWEKPPRECSESLLKTEPHAKIQNDVCTNILNLKRIFSCKAPSTPSFPPNIPKVSFIFYLITVSTVQPSSANSLSWKCSWVIRGFSFVFIFFPIAPSLLIVKETYVFPLQSLSKSSTNISYRYQKDSECSQALCWGLRVNYKTLNLK